MKGEIKSVFRWFNIRKTYFSNTTAIIMLPKKDRFLCSALFFLHFLLQLWIGYFKLLYTWIHIVFGTLKNLWCLEIFMFFQTKQFGFYLVFRIFLFIQSLYRIYIYIYIAKHDKRKEVVFIIEHDLWQPSFIWCRVPNSADILNIFMQSLFNDPMLFLSIKGLNHYW